MPLEKKRWLVLLSSCLINLCIGSLYAWSIFATPLSEELSIANIAIVFTIASSIGPLIMVPTGYINDRIGPRKIVFVGGILFGIGNFMCGFVDNLTMLIIMYSIVGAVGMDLCYTCTISNTVKFFPDKRGFVGGLTTAVYGISSVLIPLVAQPMIDSLGVFNTFKILGIVYLIVIVGCSFLQCQCPVGWAPEGFKPSAKISSNTEDKDWKGMLKDPIFYPMVLLMICGAFFGTMTISQASPIAQNMVGMSPAAAALAVSVLAMFNSGGRVSAGFVSDKIGRINTLVIALCLALVGMILLIITGTNQVVIFYIGIALVGVAFGSFMGIFPGFNVDQFGSKHNTANYGIMFIGYAVACMTGPILAGKIYLMTGSYNLAFVIGAVLVLIGFMLAFVYRTMANKRLKKS